MKTVKLIFLFLFFPFIFHGQSLTGLWVGTISNDSATIRKDQSFEIVLTQYKNKVYGYSRSTFIVNDTLFYVVKRVLGTIDGDVCEVKDDDIVSYNFRGRLDKGVKMISTFHFDHQDNAWKMDGEWKTNKTKKFYSVSGKMSLKEEKDPEKSKIIPHLEELKLTDDIAFYKESKKAAEPPVAAVKPRVKDNNKDQAVKDVKPPIASTKETKADKTAAITPNTESVVPTKQPVTNNKKDSLVTAQSKTGPAKEINQPVNNAQKDLVIKEEKTAEKQQPQKSEAVTIAKPVEQKKEPLIELTNKETKKQEAISADIAAKEKNKSQPITNTPELKPAIPKAAAEVAERKIQPPQVVNFKSDSLELSLYDNGEVDGDTVSVLLNGEIILAKQGLKASAIKKTIYVTPGKDDSMILVLYAENLGKYPPNTGLLVVHDGDDVYQVRFSADLQQNAAVIFKRKRK
ncbi:MAG: hypothetical protein Q8941_14430 [Bacteroidota bacterium]|nr:hypothetical protein [Bacteroidota bacterium]